MDDLDKYLFDLQGFITVPSALSLDQLKALNTILDEHIEAECEPDMQTHRFSENLPWGKPYIDLIDNPTMTPIWTQLLVKTSGGSTMSISM